MNVRRPRRGFDVVDIGPLDHVLRNLPTAARKRRGIKTVCSACGENIEDETFCGGFKEGHLNLILHNACAPAEGGA